ncbi:OmpA family protein [Pseudomonadota bacterium]
MIGKTVALAGLLALGLAACAETAPQPQTGALNAQETQAYNEAIGHFEKMRAEKPGEIEAVLGLARNLRWAGRVTEAGTALEASQAQFGADGRFQAELGKVRLIQGLSGEGVQLLQSASANVGDDWRLYSALGIGLDYQERYQDAHAAYNTALNMCPDDPAVINNLGISQGLSGRLDQAIRTLQRALSYGSHTDKIKRNLQLFTDARDLCASCDTGYLKGSGGMILAAGLMGTDQEGPCTPEPEYTAAAPVMVEQLAPEAQMPSINIKVYFEFDSAILKPEARTVLDNLGRALTYGELNTYRFEIAGHTDAVGSDRYNQVLSERRAETVLSYLVENFGIDPQRIDAVGYGESRLLNPDDPEGDTNRRVQVTRLGKM